VAERARAERNSPVPDLYATSASNDLTDDVFVGMFDLFGIWVFARPKGDDAAGEMLRFKTANVVNLVIDFLEPLERSVDLYDFHCSIYRTGS